MLVYDTTTASERSFGHVPTGGASCAGYVAEGGGDSGRASRRSRGDRVEIAWSGRTRRARMIARKRAWARDVTDVTAVRLSVRPPIVRMPGLLDVVGGMGSGVGAAPVSCLSWRSPAASLHALLPRRSSQLSSAQLSSAQRSSARAHELPRRHERKRGGRQRRAGRDGVGARHADARARDNPHEARAQQLRPRDERAAVAFAGGLGGTVAVDDPQLAARLVEDTPAACVTCVAYATYVTYVTARLVSGTLATCVTYVTACLVSGTFRVGVRNEGRGQGRGRT